jgi:hypothetical protein
LPDLFDWNPQIQPQQLQRACSRKLHDPELRPMDGMKFSLQTSKPLVKV